MWCVGCVGREPPDAIIMSGVMDVRDEIAATFDAAKTRGFVHAREIGFAKGEMAEIDLDADRPVSRSLGDQNRLRRRLCPGRRVGPA